MFEKIIKKGLEASKAVAGAVADAADKASTHIESKSEKVYVPGTVRAVAILVSRGGPTKNNLTLASMMLKDVGIHCRADLEAAKWVARDSDIDVILPHIFTETVEPHPTMHGTSV
jgi:hypothetical protein